MLNYKFKLMLIIGIMLTANFVPKHLAVARVGDAQKTFKTPGEHPTGLTFDGNHLWLADGITRQIDCIQPQTGNVIRSLPTPGFEPRGLAWDGQLIWCTDASAGWIYGINPQTGIADKVLESNAPKPGGLTFDGEFLWLIDRSTNKLLKINRRDGMMHENIPAPTAHSNDLTFDGQYIWVTDNGNDMLYRIEPQSGRVITSLPSVGPYPYGVSWVANQLWYADYQKCTLHQINLDDSDFTWKRQAKTYRWQLTHDFRNFGPDNIPELTIYMAIPGNLDNQEILEPITYTPQPTRFVTDRWGQKFACFQFKNVAPATFLRPTMRVKACLFHTEYVIFPERVGSFDKIPSEIKENYLADGFKYDLQHPLIQEGVKSAVGEEKHPYWIFRNIYDYICEKIDYKLKPLGGWNPAPTVLKRGTGSCSEYTFIFIAMCRAAGLPTRYAGSVVVRSQDKGIDDVWHRWAEVYLPNYGWIPVDVSAGDRRGFPAEQASTIGVLRNKYLITTKSGGDSEYLEFYYNFNAQWKTKGKCKIHTKQYAEFIPVE